MKFLVVAIGGVLGSLLRWALTTQSNSAIGTLVANLSGVALAAFLLVFIERRGSQFLRHFFLPGFCGGLTTFSALALEAVNGSGFIYLLATIALSLLIVAIVIPMARRIVPVNS
jgi:CrcB protein